MKIHHKTFHEYCSCLRGYKFYNKSRFEIFKFQLYWKGIKAEDLLERQTKYTIVKTNRNAK